MPFRCNGLPVRLTRRAELPEDPVERRLYKVPDLPFPANDHTEDAGHDTADRDDRIARTHYPADPVAVFERQGAGKVDAHQVVFLGTEIGRSAEGVVFRIVLRLADPAQDLFPCLGVDPHPELFFAADAGFLRHESVDVFPLTSRVRADIDRINILVRQDLLYDPELFLNAVYDFVFVRFGKERERCKRPFLIFRVIGVRITHCDQVPDAPGHNGIFRFHIAVFRGEPQIQGVCELPGDARFFRDEDSLAHSSHFLV